MNSEKLEKIIKSVLAKSNWTSNEIAGRMLRVVIKEIEQTVENVGVPEWYRKFPLAKETDEDIEAGFEVFIQGLKKLKFHK